MDSEVRDAAIKQAKSLQNIVGDHFPFCDANKMLLCSCGMTYLLVSRRRLEEQQRYEWEIVKVLVDSVGRK